ncbi:ArsR family transcriptional regulator [Hydrogenoanaerobacterium saccharovorans]|uniref:Transcriptional regulator, ArsR family n=1 Tax=Hydrogenoanaerobacterium saccharovorans TaxID=474960 RepID=A0A1H8BLR9_9FIRM|nr:metalloregulator ArsR/SmtB family transcription factor [Hydrogenoanaerobacterium saccharovorans]RPF47339.1 ArsR family transcriptional regulator [Hydrogenoanaerobacterium saccharovorans]SEM83805.1 transcriptional regulator, ArsR family [Hydrogenoanaerobacterium saccharovorans]
MKTSYDVTAEVFKALCDPNRLIVLELLQTGEKCACMLQEELNISQPTLSYHMKVLCDSGIVQSRKEGKWTHYSLSEDGCKNAMKLLQQITAVSPVSKRNSCSCR